MVSDPFVRPVRDADLGAVLAMLGVEWPAIDWPRRFQRAWGEGAAVVPSLPRGFVHEHAGEVLGYFGSIALPYQVAGAASTACIATSLCVQPKARGKGIGQALVRAFDAQPCALRINSTPNVQSARLFASLGYSPIDAAAGRHVLAHARQPFGALRRAWRARGRGAMRALGALLPPDKTPAPALHCTPLRGPSDELDALWTEHRAAHPTTLWRSSAVLRWLLFADPRVTVIGCRSTDGSLRGYAAFRVDRGELRQVDVFPAHDDAVLVALALAGIHHAADAGTPVVRFLSVPERTADQLRQHHCEPVAGDVTLLVRGGESRNAWFTRIDGDRWL